MPFVRSILFLSEMKLLSVIVPVYNVVGYLPKCLDSILEQDIDAEVYEIIVVNDGSTDNSEEIIKEYQKENDNIILISQVNQGLSSARNAGIDRATGKYILFVDSDDYIEKNAVFGMLNRAIELNLDVLRFNYNRVDSNYTIIPKNKNATYAIEFKEDVVSGSIFLSERMGWACYVPMYLFKNSFIKEGKFTFKEGIYYEDVEWLPRVLLQARRVSSLDQYFYNYVQRQGSITKGESYEKKEKIVRDKLLLIETLVEMAGTNKEAGVLNWINGMISLAVISILSYSAKQMPDKKKDIISKLRGYNIFPLKQYRFTIKQRLTVFVVNISPYWFSYLKKNFGVF